MKYTDFDEADLERVQNQRCPYAMAHRNWTEKFSGILAKIRNNCHYHKLWHYGYYGIMTIMVLWHYGHYGSMAMKISSIEHYSHYSREVWE